MESISYSVYAENCPGLEQDSLISSGNSCSCIFGQGVIDMSALSWRHIQGDAGRKTGAKAENGNLWKCCPASSPKHGGSVTSLAATLES